LADSNASNVPSETISQGAKLRQTQARLNSQASQKAGIVTPARSLKQKRKDSLRLALAAIKNKVPEEGRNVFKGG
jgi:hypothetical protein